MNGPGRVGHRDREKENWNNKPFSESKLHQAHNDEAYFQHLLNKLALKSVAFVAGKCESLLNSDQTRSKVPIAGG